MRTIWILMLTVCGSMMMLATADNSDIPSFDEFAAAYDKKYPVSSSSSSSSAKSVAKANYENNVQKIKALRSNAEKKNSNTKFGVNHFADLSIVQFRSQYMGLQVPASAKRALQQTRRTTTKTTRTTTTRTTRTTTTKRTTTRTTRTTTTRSTRTTTTKSTTTTTTTTSNTPQSSFDWSDQIRNVMPPIKNQGGCGSCWAFAAIALVETYYARKGNPLTQFSEQQLVDCQTDGSFGCRGGWPGFALQYVQDYGSMNSTVYPYTGRDETCKFKSASVMTKINNFVVTNTESDWFNKLSTFGPVLVCLDADSFQFYYGGIMKADECERNSINHAVVIVGYGTENGINYWKIRNSWNTWWGESGYIRMERGKDACAVTGYDAFYIES